MIKRILLLFCLFFSLNQARAQFDTSFIKTNIKRCSDSLTEAFRSRNWPKFTRFSYPAMVGAMGGKHEFIVYLFNMFNNIPDSAWKKYETGNILQIIKTPGDYQATIELITVINWEGVRLTTISHLIAESWDGGMQWTFFDSQGDKQAAKMIKPDLSDELIIPERNEKREPIKQ